MDLGVEGRTVIVTGATGGLGRHIVRGFADEGADVVIGYRGAEADAERMAKEVGERALPAQHDLGDPDGAQRLVDTVRDWSGRVDVLVNNAVYWGADALEPDLPFEEVPDDHWTGVVRLNVEGALRLSRAVAPLMRQRGWGRMVHISSGLATDGAAGAEYYASAKAALHGFSRSAAFSLARHGDILSNVVMPGLTRTDTNAEIVKAAGEHYSSLAALGRLLDAEEVARSVVYLGSAANTGITGEVVSVSGGS